MTKLVVVTGSYVWTLLAFLITFYFSINSVRAENALFISFVMTLFPFFITQSMSFMLTQVIDTFYICHFLSGDVNEGDLDAFFNSSPTS